MKLDIKFREVTERLPFEFGEVNNISDGGFERGYAAGQESQCEELLGGAW